MEELELKSADGTRLVAFRWTPEGDARGDVLLTHGLAEHMGRYVHVAAALTGDGWRVTGLNLRGHGESDGKRGHVDRWQDYVDDLRAAADSIGGPYVLHGHSMGGLVALDHLRTGTDAQAAVLTGPLLGVAVQAPRWKTTLAGLLSTLLPRLSMGNELDPEMISTDPAVVKAYRDDPLVYTTITPRWYTEAVAAMDRVKAHAASYRLPLWMGWGTQDKMVSVADIEAFCDAYGGELARSPWEDLFHEIHNEPTQSEVLAAIRTWLDTTLPA